MSLTLFRAPEPKAAKDAISSRQSRFLESEKASREFTAEDYASTTGVSERQARRDLAQIEALGLLERRGKGPATTYRQPSSLRK